MEVRCRILVTLYIAQLLTIVQLVSGQVCRGLSADVKCTCDNNGRCMKGTVEIDPWLNFALKTQRETQIDFPFDHFQIIGAHNAFNNRAYGILYGAKDTCFWPPPYEYTCLGLANHEFSITDMLNMGVRGVELDLWWCAEAMRIAHLGTPIAVGCTSANVLFADVIADIGEWMKQQDNQEDILRIYLNEPYDQGHDPEVNGPLERYIGHDHMLSPADLRNTYQDQWPTVREMRMVNKTVVIAGRTHQGKYIHTPYWGEFTLNKFTSYPQCGGKSDTNPLRFYGDSTHYVFDIIYDGPAKSGFVTDLTELIKCGVEYPDTDQVTPQEMETAIYSWAKGQPSRELTVATCVMMNGDDTRWYTPADCDQELNYACQNINEPDDWTMSSSRGPYDINTGACPDGYRFSLPHNGYRNQKLLTSLNGHSVWLNYSPWLPGYVPPLNEEEPSGGSSDRSIYMKCILIITTFMVFNSMC